MAYFPDLQEPFQRALETLKTQRVAVLGHVRPDGDCIGSQIALARVLRALGGDAICANHHAVPEICATFVQDTPFYRDDAPGFSYAGRVAATVDCADRRRLGPVAEAAFASVALNLDHHISNALYGEVNLVDGQAAAAAEILAGLILDLDLPLDAVTAQALYVGIATDTGQFRFSAVTQRAFDLCSALMEAGADPAAAAMELYEQQPPSKLALLQRFLASFRYVADGKACIGVLRAEDFEATGARSEDTEGLVDYARAIRGVEIGVLLEDCYGKVKGSFRAKDPVHRVDQLAKAFRGGGHAAAAGFNPELPLDALEPAVIDALENHFARLRTPA